MYSDNVDLLRMSYLISCYPAYSHTFIQREIEELRKHGFIIYTASINHTDIPLNALSSINQMECNSTFYVKKEGIVKALQTLMAQLIKKPISVFKGYFYALSLAKWDLKRMVYHSFYFMEALIVGSWMNKHHVNHLHVHFANPASTVALIAKHIFAITFSMTIHGPDEFYDVTLNHVKKKIEEAKFIFCISTYTKSQILRLVPPLLWKNCQLAYLGIDISKYCPSYSNKDEKKGIQILCVARLSPNKGQIILIEAVKKLTEQQKNICLILVGDGPDRDELQKLVNDLQLDSYIVFKGALESNEILNLYQQSDIFVLTSFAEGLPVVLMEAMAFEIPCIATAINGIPELINHEINGYLIPPSDVDMLSKTLIKLIENESLRKALGKRARETILEKFDLSKNVNYLSELFRQNLLK